MQAKSMEIAAVTATSGAPMSLPMSARAPGLAPGGSHPSGKWRPKSSWRRASLHSTDATGRQQLLLAAIARDQRCKQGLDPR